MATPQSYQANGSSGLGSSKATASAVSTAAAGGGEETLSPLEQELLDEYAKLAGNLGVLSSILSDLASRPSAQILDAMRGLERKTTTVFTLLKASVYSIVLQQEIFSDQGAEGEDESGGQDRN